MGANNGVSEGSITFGDIDGDEDLDLAVSGYDNQWQPQLMIFTSICVEGTYVSTNGNDITGDGSKEKPFKTIQRGIQAASLLTPNNVYISEGTYPEHVVVCNGVSILGGYSSGFTNRDINLVNYRTIIDGTGNGRCMYASGIEVMTVIEGLIISNGYLAGSMKNGAGIHCNDCSSSLIIKNNEIKSNTSLDSYGGGIYLWYSSPWIYNNKIINNNAVYGAGLFLTSSSPEINNNIINANVSVNGGGIYIYNSASEIYNNVINNNKALLSGAGGGLCMANDPNYSLKIFNNIIRYNFSTYAGGGIYGTGGGLSSCINNNIISDNIVETPSGEKQFGAGICIFSYNVRICNNIIKNNRVQYSSPSSLFHKGYGGGIYGKVNEICSNIIYGNYANDRGGGIALYAILGVKTKVYNNKITYNTARRGGGVYCTSLISDLSATSIEIYNNIINSNDSWYERGISGMELWCYYGSMNIINNAFINNYGRVISIDTESPFWPPLTFINNIIYGENSEVGIYEWSEDPFPNLNFILSNNCFYGMQNNRFYYDELTRKYITNEAGLNSMSDIICGGNIVADPQMMADNMHLQPTSPCINAGIDPTGYISSLNNDLDGDERPLLDQFDIGADESTNILVIVGPYVSTNGDDVSGDGSKINPFKTIHRGIEEAVLLGSNNVYISEGTYPEHVLMSNGVSIRGGYSSDFNSRDTNLINYRTKINGTGDGRCIYAQFISEETVIEGLIISNGYLTGSMNNGAGIYCDYCSSDLIIKNNEIKNNTSLNSYGGGIYLWYSSPGIYNNKIINNNAVYGSGLYLTSSSPKIYYNTINDNSGGNGAGIYMYNSTPEIYKNKINNNENVIGGDGGGLFSYESSPDIYNNIISSNSAAYNGGGLYLTSSSPRICSNIIKYNNAGENGGGICGMYYCSPLINNNIINNNRVTNSLAEDNQDGDICILNYWSDS